MTSPVHSLGLLSSLALANHLTEHSRDHRKCVERLEQRLLSVNQVSQAKSILMRTRNVSDADAYKIIRDQAMSKRVATEEIARAIIHADDILSFSPRSAA